MAVVPAASLVVRRVGGRCCACAKTFSKGRSVGAFVHFLSYAALYVTWKSVAVLNCAPSDDGVGSRLVADLNVRCWSESHVPAALAAAVLLVILVAYPAVVLYLLLRARRKANALVLLFRGSDRVGHARQEGNSDVGSSDEIDEAGTELVCLCCWLLGLLPWVGEVSRAILCSLYGFLLPFFFSRF